MEKNLKNSGKNSDDYNENRLCIDDVFRDRIPDLGQIGIKIQKIIYFSNDEKSYYGKLCSTVDVGKIKWSDWHQNWWKY